MDWKSIVGTVAPTLATALGGPLAGLATQFIGGLFGLGDGVNESDVMSAVKGATPEDLLKLKNADNDFKLKIAALGIDLEKIAADDRNSARRRQVDMNDWTPSVLAVVILCAWAWLNFYIFTTDIPAANKDFIMRTLGTVDAVVMGVVYFFFGSSAGSAKMKDIMGGRNA